MHFTAFQIAEQLEGEVIGDGSIELTGLAPADSSGVSDLTFAEKESYFVSAEQSDACAILVPGGFTSSKKVLIRVPNERVAVSKLLPVFFPPDQHPPGTHLGAIIAPSAQIDPSAHIGPNCVIGPRVKIGARCALLSGKLRRNCRPP
jgi:UDP-3-O-[3-hydroxymyristoyl] glucosamine N-acyltransferase